MIEGTWADNEEMARYYRSRSSRLREAGAALLGKHDSYRKYHRIEAQLPFSGGPAAERVTAFLRGKGLHDVEVEPLVDPILWGETPRFPRYVAVGCRSPVAEARS